MSLNWAELNERKQPIPINDEVIVRSEPNADLVLSFNPPDTNQAASAKGKAKASTLKATGTVYVSDQRVRRSSPGPVYFRPYSRSHNTPPDSVGLCLVGIRPARFSRYLLGAAAIPPVHTVPAAVFRVQPHRPRHQARPWGRPDRGSKGRTALERQGNLRTFRRAGEEQGKGAL